MKGPEYRKNVFEKLFRENFKWGPGLRDVIRRQYIKNCMGKLLFLLSRLTIKKKQGEA